MKLNVADRENLRKRVKVLIPQMKKSEIVNRPNNYRRKESPEQLSIIPLIECKMKGLSKTKIKRAAQPLGQLLEIEN